MTAYFKKLFNKKVNGLINETNNIEILLENLDKKKQILINKKQLLKTELLDLIDKKADATVYTAHLRNRAYGYLPVDIRENQEKVLENINKEIKMCLEELLKND